MTLRIFFFNQANSFAGRGTAQWTSPLGFHGPQVKNYLSWGVYLDIKLCTNKITFSLNITRYIHFFIDIVGEGETNKTIAGGITFRINKRSLEKSDGSLRLWHPGGVGLPFKRELWSSGGLLRKLIFNSFTWDSSVAKLVSSFSGISPPADTRERTLFANRLVSIIVSIEIGPISLVLFFRDKAISLKYWFVAMCCTLLCAHLVTCFSNTFAVLVPFFIFFFKLHPPPLTPLESVLRQS